MRISRHDVLKLYRELISYSKTLKYTDKNYYLDRVKSEFIQNKHLEGEEEILHQYNAFNVQPVLQSFFRNKTDIDYSRFPKLNEEELEEQFISGSGPGGSKVNKKSNCVLLKHLPTGIVVKCHKSRLLQDNQKKARELLLHKLDDFYNGDISISAQKKKLDKLDLISKQKKKEKLNEMKKNFQRVCEELNKNQP